MEGLAAPGLGAEPEGYSPSPGGGDPPPGGAAPLSAAARYDVSASQDFWDTRPLVPGCILEMPVTREMSDGEEEALLAVFVMEANYEESGCWVKAKMLGADAEWARALGIRIVSRERQYIHICRGGRAQCKDLGRKVRHVDRFGVLPPGEGCPGYVEKAKMREWRKWYQSLQGKPPGGAASAGEAPKKAPAADPPGTGDRISALKRRLQDKRSAGRGETGRRAHPLSPPRAAFSPAPRAILDDPQGGRSVERERQDRQEGEPPHKRKRSHSVGKALAEVAAAQGRRGGSRRRRSRSSGSSSSGSRSRSRVRRGRKKKKKKRKRSRRDSRSSSSGRTSSSSSLVPPLQRKANREPGSVLKMLLQNVAEALAEAAVGGEAERDYLGGKANQVSSYFQIVARPQMSGKIRDLRELETIARCLDYLKLGRLAEVGDALAGRFMAVEAAALSNSWQDAQHLEVIPAHHGGVASPAVLLRAQRHAKQVEKATSRGSWRRPGHPSAPAPAPTRPEGGPSRPKGKGDGKGKGRRAKGGKGGELGRTRTRTKPTEAPERSKPRCAGCGL